MILLKKNVWNSSISLSTFLRSPLFIWFKILEHASFIAVTDWSLISKIYSHTESLKSLSYRWWTIFLSSYKSDDLVFRKSKSSLLMSAQTFIKLNLWVLWCVRAHSLQILYLSSKQKNSNSNPLWIWQLIYGTESYSSSPLLESSRPPIYI